MAELPFNIVIKRFGMVCLAICFESCQKKERGVTDTTNTFCFMISHFILL